MMRRPPRSTLDRSSAASDVLPRRVPGPQSLVPAVRFPIPNSLFPMRTAVYAGSFDPITRGHEDLIRRSLAFVDRIVVAVATNISKQPLFTLEERVAFVRAAVGNDPRVEVQQFNGLLVDFARAVGANLIIRGLRAVADFEYEFQMALMLSLIHISE